MLIVSDPGCTTSLERLDFMTGSKTMGSEEFGTNVGPGTNAPGCSFSAGMVDIPAPLNVKMGCSGVTKIDLPFEKLTLMNRVGARCLLRFAMGVFSTLPSRRSTENILSRRLTLAI